MRIGVFGGAFNPVHNGHLHLMQAYIDVLQLDKLLLIPTAKPPHKTGKYLAPEQDRLAMLQLLADEDSRIEVSDLEFQRKGKSYTYETLLDLKKQYPGDAFYLLIGADQYLSFHTWYRPEEILQLATVCTMARNAGEGELLQAYRREHPAMKHSIISDWEPVEVSSTEIRERVRQHQPIDALVPPAVAEYIKEHGLYV